MLTPKTRQIFRNDAVDSVCLDIIHHALEIRAFKIRSGPSIIHILIHDTKSVFLRELLENGALRFDTYAITIVFIITAQTHIESRIIVSLFHILQPPHVKQPTLYTV